MGREIRKVPADWQHPMYATEQLIIDGGDDSTLEDFVRAFARPRYGMREIYHPLYDCSQREAMADWLEEKTEFEQDMTPEGIQHRSEYTFEEWHGEAPDPEYHRPDWPEESRTHYQMYETVSEGTPVSPVFAALEELIEWLTTQGYSPQAARAFVKQGWAPSLVGVSGVGLWDGVTAAGIFEAKDREHV